ncbi:MAG TPA: SEC-C domain-containing protein [Steroidobacter sp.]|uniref:SEC-C domain-containing protein n=1 Tax=Steroidobacter sp. TaxID=1978227 RepID=UPI002EDAC7D1
MTRALQTEFGTHLLAEVSLEAKKVLRALNAINFNEAKDVASTCEALLARDTRASMQDEAQLNDLYVLKVYSRFLLFYTQTWETVLLQRFSESWRFLQDSLDCLRLVKKFSAINIGFFEKQLLELEKTYPYGVFFSVGMKVGYYECSVCGLDIDSDSCAHMRGQLYSGVLAQAIAREDQEVDHIAMVPNPRDKRCVVQYDDDGEQFKIVRYLAELLRAARFRISDFGTLRFSKRRRPNPGWRKLGRNEQCYCGSGSKFKHCCISNAYEEGDHVDIVAEPRNVEDVAI